MIELISLRLAWGPHGEALRAFRTGGLRVLRIYCSKAGV